MRRCACRNNSIGPDESGFTPGDTLKAVHKTTGSVHQGVYTGLSKRKTTLHIGDLYINPNQYTITAITI